LSVIAAIFRVGVNRVATHVWNGKTAMDGISGNGSGGGLVISLLGDFGPLLPVGAGPLCKLLHAPSTSLSIPATISFALFAQSILVKAGLSQFGAHISPNWSLAGLPVSAAISFAPLS
jgi:hypothetical protein